jgi:hypothetical protein
VIAAALAGALSLTRIGFGVAYLVRPGQAGRGWIGRVARDPAAQVGMRGLGARDLALGAGALAALGARDARTARRFLVAQTLADAADVFATVAARKRLPDKGFRFALAMASGSAAVGAVSAATLRSGGD